MLRVLDALRAESAAHRVVFTGGDPLMPYGNHLEPALRHAAELGFAVNMYANGLLPQDRFEGYFDRFTANVDVLAGHRKTMAFNTLTSPGSIGRLPEIASLIRQVASRTKVEYWLISPYRPIGRADPKKADIYGFTTEDFSAAVAAERGRTDGIEIYDQPTRSDTDPHPFRAWVLADGTVTVDLGRVGAARNEVLGNVLDARLAPLIRGRLSSRGNTFDLPALEKAHSHA